MPLRVVRRLSRPEVDPDRAELRGVRCLRRTAEDIRAPGDLEVHESRRDDRRLELCLQQSAGDSPLPEVDVALRAVADRLLDEDVADLQSASRFEHARHFAEARELVGK
jgi:hypothetical protein